MCNPTKWIRLVPLKVMVFVWHACIDRIPSAVALSRRGISLPSIACQIFISGIDEADHFLVGCPFAKDVLAWIFNRCNLPFQQFDSVGELILYAASLGNCPKKRKILLAIFYGYLWYIWRARSDIVFNKTHISTSKLEDIILSTVFSWIKNRGSFENCNWVN
uniref:Reverse transcriptase zinc-binding domain-containing protein n=1 Tax=Lactuca sativa TaxID=4236 RepID=A0A9R1W1G8_LACSA|nr:hypothetical protein LSAT_V11C400197810 [Lactuca sativa]